LAGTKISAVSTAAASSERKICLVIIVES
jgi:hypothetical protein